MPILRQLSGGAQAFGTPGLLDGLGRPAFRQGREETTRLTVDWRGEAGTVSISSSAWVATGCTATSPAIDGKTVSALIAAVSKGATVKNTITLSDGRVLVETVAFIPETELA